MKQKLWKCRNRALFIARYARRAKEGIGNNETATIRGRGVVVRMRFL
jgi:hypothetical protein